MATIIKKFWSDEDNPKRIQLVKENVILWDVRNDECKLGARNTMLWKKITDFGTDSGGTQWSIIAQYLVKLYY